MNDKSYVLHRNKPFWPVSTVPLGSAVQFQHSLGENASADSP